jgi:hypothetical protein
MKGTLLILEKGTQGEEEKREMNKNGMRKDHGRSR